jgi:hypothetical protein
MSLKFSEKTVTIDEQVLHGSYAELENAVVAFFWVGDKPKMGSLSATLPDRSSSQLLGDRNEMISRMMGERIASQFNKIALVSTNLPREFDGRPVLELLNELLTDGK